MKLKNLRDVILFSKILSAGLVIAGYVFLAVWCGNWLMQRGFNMWLSLCVIIIIACFGMWQGYMLIQKWRKK